MRNLAIKLWMAVFSALLCTATTVQVSTAQDSSPQLKTESTSTSTTSTESGLDKTDSQLGDATDSDAHEGKAFQSLIFSVQTNDGFTIYGIPTKPNLLPVTLFGAEVKIPWSSIRKIRFSGKGSVALDLDDGSKLKGFTAVQRIVLNKDWGTIAINREKMKTISRASERTSTKQSSFLTPGVSYRAERQTTHSPALPQPYLQQPAIPQPTAPQFQPATQFPARLP